MPWRQPAVWKAGVVAGWSVYTIGGFLIAQGTSVIQNNAGVGVAVIGLLTLGLQYFYKDRSEERATRVAQLRERDAAREAELATVRAHAAELEGDLAEVRARAHSLAVRLRELEPLVASNTVGIAATEGRVDGLLLNLQKAGIFSPSSASLPTFDPSTARTPRATVLIVEDDAGTARLMCDLFTSQGYQACAAGTVAEALDKVGKNPHWVCLDLKLAGGDGLDVARKVRAEGLPVRVAVVTGAVDEAKLAEARGLAEVVVGKPLTSESFRELLRLMEAIPKIPRPAKGADDVPPG